MIICDILLPSNIVRGEARSMRIEIQYLYEKFPAGTRKVKRERIYKSIARRRSIHAFSILRRINERGKMMPRTHDCGQRLYDASPLLTLIKVSPIVYR